MKLPSLIALITTPVAVLALIAPAQAAPDPPDTGTTAPPCIRTVKPMMMWKAEGTSSTNTTFNVSVMSLGCMASGTVEFNTEADSARRWAPLISSWDYYSASGTLTFAAGDNSVKVIPVTVRADDDLEPNENFWIKLHTPSSRIKISGCSPASIVIANDDPATALPVDPGYYCPE